MADQADRPSRAEAILQRLARLSGRGGQRSARTQQVLLAIATVVFVAATAWAWQQLPPDDRSLSVVWFAIAFMLALLTLLMNSLEFGISAELRGLRSPTRDSWRVSVLGSAANLLPVPGAVVVRAQALRQLGERTSGAVIVTGLVGLVWVATAAILAGIVLLGAPAHRLLAAAFLTVGVLTVAGSAVILRRGGGARPTIARLIGIELISVVVSGMRLYAAARAADLPIDLPSALTISLGGILSHVIGVFPGGLGLKEVVSGAFGTLVGVPASVGVLASAIDRLVLYAALGIAAVPLLVVARRTADDAAEPTPARERPKDGEPG